jgi:hypothetical protein
MSDIDWDHWKLEKKLPLWQVMLLSLGVNPEKVRLKKIPESIFFSLKPEMKFDSIAERKGYKDQDFEKRSLILEKRRFEEKFDSGMNDIDLEKFINWAIKNNLTIPDEMKSLYGQLVVKEQFEVVDGKQFFRHQQHPPIIQFKTQPDWVEVVRNVVKLRCDQEKNKSKIIQKDLATFAEGYLYAFRAIGPMNTPLKADTIIKEAFRAGQWWKRSIKPE